jgi:hypothetical protein
MRFSMKRCSLGLLCGDAVEGVAEFVLNETFGHDELLIGVGAVGENGLVFEVAEGVETGFGAVHAQEFPFGIGDGLDDELFGIGHRFVVSEDGGDQGLVGVDIFAGEEHFGAEQAVLESVHRTLLLCFRCWGPV